MSRKSGLDSGTRISSRKIYTGLDAFLYGLYGRTVRGKRQLRNLERCAEQVLAEAKGFEILSDRQLQERLQEIRKSIRLRRLRTEGRILTGVAALVEVADRSLGLRPHPVQVMGALAMQRGFLVEMATGEGKTLTAGLASALFAWHGVPCHVVTVNDYLVARDAEKMQEFYALAGVTTGYVQGGMEPVQRRENYLRGVVYGTSKEILADFLRDRLAVQRGAGEGKSRFLHGLLQGHGGADGPVMRGLGPGIVDEADSILIDEAVTPLIISVKSENKLLKEAAAVAHEIAGKLVRDRHYTVDRKYKETRLTDEGHTVLDELAGDLPGIWRGRSRREEIVGQALQAREFFQHGKQYVIDEGKVVIVDEFTGRLMPHRTWSHGLHQSIEARERLEISDPTETMARLSFQRYFRFYPHLCGMTGTGWESAQELWQIYGLPVVPIPTNKPSRRRNLPDRVFTTRDEKWDALVREVEEVHATGRPVLLGTRSVSVSEKLAEALTERELEFSLLNAVHHRLEAEIVAGAGEAGKITIATNMAGRGTDIKLGEGVEELGGLHVLASERHESGRVDRQLFGRCARQGDPGSTQAFIAMDDEVVVRFLPKWVRQGLTECCRWKWGKAVAVAGYRFAQRTAEKSSFIRRRFVLKTDTWLSDALSFAGPEPESAREE